MSGIGKVLAKRLNELRKERGLSQLELAHEVGTSGPIIGRYERGEITPSVNVAKKLADSLGVTIDYLVANEDTPQFFQDKMMIKRWQDIEALSSSDKKRILFVIDCLIREAKTRHAFSTNAN